MKTVGSVLSPNCSIVPSPTHDKVLAGHGLNVNRMVYCPSSSPNELVVRPDRLFVKTVSPMQISFPMTISHGYIT